MGVQVHNWNYDKSIAYIESLEDPVARRLTKLFLDSLVIFVAEKRGYPESEFDLLFFVRALSAVTCHKELLVQVLDGKGFDPGWDAINEVFGTER
jgi:hypothetical protein